MTLSREPAVVPLRTSQTTEETDDAALVARARSGNVEAFEALYRRHGGRVYALCLRLTADAQRATELTQDVFVRAWDGLPAFRGESAFGSWLHRIAVNASLMSRRSDMRRTSRVSLAEDLATTTKSAPDGVVAPRDVENAIDLERALHSLPAGARAAFVLHEIEGYTHDEIAGLTGIAAGTVRAQLHRARRLLMEALDR